MFFYKVTLVPDTVKEVVLVVLLYNLTYLIFLQGKKVPEF